MRRRFTIVEIMMVVILLTLILTALYQVFRSTQRGASEVMANQVINDEVLRLVNRITDDLREANFVDQDLPPTFDDEAQARTFNVLDGKNQLMFTKVKFDFTKNPSTFASDQVNYTQLRIVYSLGKADPDNATGPYVLFREALPFNDRRQAQSADKTKFPVMNDIDHLVFYRLKNPQAPRAGNLYLHLRMTRQDKAAPTSEKYTVDIVTSVKERGGDPE
ncbi:MAG: hypothetical protein GX442_02665 [Candidatus Riflebacteria bacterium]|nr:hypothetical protein [Candidatus Riflebacteria bacterium]